MFAPTSRYAPLPTAEHELPDGRVVVYVRRRFVPQPEAAVVLADAVAAAGERLDVLTARHLGDPEQYWRVCDANRVLTPDELERAGRPVRIPLPQA